MNLLKMLLGDNKNTKAKQSLTPIKANEKVNTED